MGTQDTNCLGIRTRKHPDRSDCQTHDSHRVAGKYHGPRPPLYSQNRQYWPASKPVSMHTRLFGALLFVCEELSA